MTGHLKILFLTHRIPYPPNKGDKIRSFNELKYLSNRHNIYLGTILDRPSEKPHIESLKPYCTDVHAIYFNKRLNLLKSLFSKKPFSVCNFYSAELQAYVDKILETVRIDAIICFSSSMAEYIFRTPRYRRGALHSTKLVMDYIDLDSDKWRQYAHYARFPRKLVYQLEHRRLLQYEIKVHRAFDHSIFVNQREINTFEHYHPDVNGVMAIPNGLDAEYFRAKQESPRNENPVLLFTGVMDYFANEDGVSWFCTDILDRVKGDFPETEFYIVGMRPTRAVRRLARIEGVTVTGYRNDIRPFYRKADVCVVPLRIARGLQNKVLEAMATGNAVVATSNATGGIICRENEDILIADDAATFADKVIALLTDETRRNEFGRRAVQTIHRHYLWKENLRKFGELFE